MDGRRPTFPTLPCIAPLEHRPSQHVTQIILTTVSGPSQVSSFLPLGAKEEHRGRSRTTEERPENAEGCTPPSNKQRQSTTNFFNESCGRHDVRFSLHLATVAVQPPRDFDRHLISIHTLTRPYKILFIGRAYIPL